MNPVLMVGPRLTGGDQSENSGAASSTDAPSASSSAKIALEVIRDMSLLIGICFFIAVISFFLVLKFAFY
jgi:hypothetical protein